MGKLVWRNLLRNKRRTILTLGSVAVAIVVLSMLGTVLAAMNAAQSTQAAQRLVVRSAISLANPLPESYWQRLERLDHVVAVAPMTWYQGIYKDTRPQNFFPRFAVDPDSLMAVFEEYRPPPEQLEAWKADRKGFIAGRSLVEKEGWEIGDSITIKGDIYPVDVELTLRGIYDAPEEPSERQIHFHRRYLEEAIGNPGLVGTYWLLLDDDDAVADVVTAAEAMFENSADQVRAETEQAFAMSFFEMLGNVRFLFGAIGLAVVISILLITANTMAMAARERTTEMAVLRTLGFKRGHIVRAVVGESLAVGLLGSLVGGALALGLLKLLAPFLEQTGLFFGAVAWRPENLAIIFGVGLVVGIISGIAPALAASQQRIVDGLRRV